MITRNKKATPLQLHRTCPAPANLKLEQTPTSPRFPVNTFEPRATGTKPSARVAKVSTFTTKISNGKTSVNNTSS